MGRRAVSVPACLLLPACFLCPSGGVIRSPRLACRLSGRAAGRGLFRAVMRCGLRLACLPDRPLRLSVPCRRAARCCLSLVCSFSVSVSGLLAARSSSRYSAMSAGCVSAGCLPCGGASRLSGAGGGTGSLVAPCLLGWSRLGVCVNY